MLFKTLSAAVFGIDASIIEVEVDVSPIRTLEDKFNTVGLPDAAVRESRERVRAALKNCGYDIPPTHTTINLAPADVKKEGSGFDLPMAVGILGAFGGITKKDLSDFVFVGELSLDGSVRGVRGALPIAIEVRARKIPRLIVPEVNAKEAAVVSGVDVYPVRSLLDVVNLLNRGDGILAAARGYRRAAGANAASRRRLQGRARPADGEARPRSRRRRRPQHPHDRAARARARPCSPSASPPSSRP